MDEACWWRAWGERNVYLSRARHLGDTEKECFVSLSEGYVTYTELKVR